MTHFVTAEVKGRVLILTLNRPDQLNALTHDIYTAIADGLDQATADGNLRAVIITGNGRAFTAGNDLKDFAGPMPDGKLPVTRFLETLRDFEKPILVAINGPAVGVGVTMLLHCDLSFASDQASFRAPFAHVGLVPEAGSSLLLPNALGTAWANDLLLAGRTLNAAEALTAGLVSRIFSPEDLFPETLRIAEDIARQAPNAMRHSKALIRSGRQKIADQMRRESTLFEAQLKSAEFAEAASAIMEKRAPVFN